MTPQEGSSDKEKSSSDVGNNIIEIGFAPRHKITVVLIQNAENHTKRKRPEICTISHQFEVGLEIERTPCQETEDKEEEGMDDLCHTRRHMKPQKTGGDVREEIDGDCPYDEWDQVFEEVFQPPSILRNAVGS